MIPYPPPSAPPGSLDPFTFTIVITNGDAAAASITIYAVAAAFQG